MKCRRISIFLFILAITAAVALRLPRLGQRPMHTDEAVHAVKFGRLLEDGCYRYDSHEYHGPTLNYLTLIPAWMSQATKFSEISENTLRVVPVFFGILLVIMPLSLVNGIRWLPASVAAVLTAISPAMVFYSRYYIQEILLVSFTFGAILSGYRYSQSKNFKWALALGIFMGLMYATKETCIIAFASILFALCLSHLVNHRHLNSILITIKEINPRHALAAVSAVVIVVVLFYSSFFTNARGILDSLLTFKSYFHRAGQNDLHIHPWYYYLKMLIYSRYAEGPVWSEGLIMILACVGWIVAMTRKHNSGVNFYLIQFIAFYTLIMTVVYFVIPYKTPWNLLGFWHGMILLAGIGAAEIIKQPKKILTRVLTTLFLIAGGLHLAWQSYQANYKYFADPVNPYVYAHPLTDVYDIVSRIEDVASAHPDGKNVYIEVICPENDYWPLPWYLRSFSNVGWWDKVNFRVPAAPIIIASPKVGKELLRKLYELPLPGKKRLYVPLFNSYMELRPQVEIRGYVTKQLWDRFQQKQFMVKP